VPKRTCSIDGCDKPATASRGWCWTHYGRFRRWGDPNRTFEQSVCSIADCDAPSRVRGWCNKHHSRWKAHGDPLVRKLHDNSGACSITACEKSASRLGMCEAHYWDDYIARPGNAAKHSAKVHTRRVKASAMSGAMSERSLSWRTLMAEGLTACYLCGSDCDLSDFRTLIDRRGSSRIIPGRRYPSLDHVTPIAEGGQHVRANAALACMDCNRRKWANNGQPAAHQRAS
jgi:hypothetical protein